MSHHHPGADSTPPRRRNSLPWILVGVLGGGCCLVIIVFAAILFPVFQTARTAAQGAVQDTLCIENLRKLGLASIMYSSDNNDILPHAVNWTGLLSPYLLRDQGPLNCPAVARGGEPNGYGYAFNIELAGKPIARIQAPEGTPVIFDSILVDRDAASGLETLPDPPRHGNGTANNAAFADGSVSIMPRGTP
jgi:prepilin-type processing-associated H-X9-DG protein